MGNARAWFPISRGLLAWKHYQRIGAAWMIFLWMIHEQRAPKDGEPNDGAVRNGEPISYECIGACLHGMPARTVERHVGVLEAGGYIRSESGRGRAKRYWVTNPIRWEMVGLRGAATVLAKVGAVGEVPAEVGVECPQKCGGSAPIFGEANKEQEPRTKNKTKGGGARPTLEQVSAYCKERNNHVNPEKWMAHYMANGWKVGRNNMVDWKAAVRTWEHNGVTENGTLAAPKRKIVDVVDVTLKLRAEEEAWAEEKRKEREAARLLEASGGTA